ncbi:hypothetical protein [Catalinimonas niigatensis]|uniref:hypothetical protein n=1 Tax=Catalinimonas niigatensis TaxID=1397264 RepID=UPI002665C8DA|nr:hypothetical protein [Catalinimonas niigatensis]WPP49282.1 hypothetical protein PZB72_21675 [Catalinimonas niigatensis]
MRSLVLKNPWKGICIVTIGLAMVLIPFSLLVGWNIFTLLLFWFMIVPALTLYLPKMMNKDRNHLFESLAGMVLFYGLMVFMIYDHYQTDYFQVMMYSCGFNLLVVTLFGWLRMRHSRA